MALIIRIDVDRPYGKQPLVRHLLSRLSSDLYLPRVGAFGYLSELKTMLGWLNEARARSYVFFRRCTLPNEPVLKLLNAGKHVAGLHLENSRSFETFCEEIGILEKYFGTKMSALSKHGSGKGKYGFHHYPPYEPEKYMDWAERVSMRLLLGNLEDPTLEPIQTSKGLLTFPSAFWLEPYWRDTKTYTVEWLMEHAQHQDIVLLVHPENVIADPKLTADFRKLIGNLGSRVLQ
jgi:hypothetical protein